MILRESLHCLVCRKLALCCVSLVSTSALLFYAPTLAKLVFLRVFFPIKFSNMADVPPAHPNTSQDLLFDEKLENSTVQAPSERETPVSGVVGILASTVAGLQKNMSTVFLRMSGSLQQSLAMMDSMNSCMEEYVKNSVIASVSIKPAQATGDNGITLRIGVRNKGRFPISGIKLSVILKYRDGNSAKAVISEDPIIHSRKRQKCSQSGISDVSEVDLCWRSCQSGNDVDSSCEFGPLNLAPADGKSWDVELRLPEVTQYDGILLSCFPSPGSGNTLEAMSPFKVGLLHQCRHRPSTLKKESTPALPRSASDNARPIGPLPSSATRCDTSESEARAIARVAPLRRLLGIPARAAVAEGQLAVLDGPDGLPVRPKTSYCYLPPPQTSLPFPSRPVPHYPGLGRACSVPKPPRG